MSKVENNIQVQNDIKHIIKDSIKEIEDYINQDIFNPKYLFHGSPYELDLVNPEKSHEDEKVIFLTSWILNAAAYAFRNKLKEINEYYVFNINNNGKLPAMTFEVENIPEDLFGYIYVFKKNKNMIKDNHNYTTQYRCYTKEKPIDKIIINYKEFEKYFERIKPIK